MQLLFSGKQGGETPREPHMQNKSSGKLLTFGGAKGCIYASSLPGSSTMLPFHTTQSDSLLPEAEISQTRSVSPPNNPSADSGLLGPSFPSDNRSIVSDTVGLQPVAGLDTVRGFLDATLQTARSRKLSDVSHASLRSQSPTPPQLLSRSHSQQSHSRSHVDPMIISSIPAILDGNYRKSSEQPSGGAPESGLPFLPIVEIDRYDKKIIMFVTKQSLH